MKITRQEHLRPGAYLLHNKETDETYVGSTVNLYRRENTHRCELNKNIHTNKKLQNAFNRNPNFDFVPIPIDDIEEAKDLEQMIIDEFIDNPLFLNMRSDARNSAIGVACSQETREKIRQALLGRKASPETKARCSLAQMGNKKGLGTKKSDEAKELSRQAAIKQWQSDEHRKKMSEINFERKADVAMTVSVNGVIYRSLTYAQAQLHSNAETIKKRCLSDDYPDWFFVNKGEQF